MSSLNKSKIIQISIFAVLAGGILVFAALFSGKAPITKAGSADNVSGWAWSDTIGWIGFNCNNPELPAPRCTKDYGVHICESDADPHPRCAGKPAGSIVGYAWSENIGWIKFDPSPDPITGEYGNGTAPQESAKLNLATNQITGWARACAGTINGDCTGATRTDGWDGWIKMSGTATDSSIYGVSRSGCDLTGFAWGSDVVGWISFDSKNCDPDGDRESNGIGACPSIGTTITTYGVVTTFCENQAPSAKNLNENIDSCAWWKFPQVAPGLSITLKWDYSDPEGDPQTAYEIWLDDSSGFSDPKFNDLVEPGLGFSYTLNLGNDDNSDWLSQLSWDTTYHWKVRVRDQKGNWSWSDVKSFTTPKHDYPAVNFTWAPPNPSINEVTQFTDQTTVAPGLTISAWAWTFPGGDPATSTEQNPIVKFLSTGAKSITLRVTDSDDFSCQIPKTINSQLPLPEWIEIAPF